MWEPHSVRRSVKSRHIAARRSAHGGELDKVMGHFCEIPPWEGDRQPWLPGGHPSIEIPGNNGIEATSSPPEALKKLKRPSFRRRACAGAPAPPRWNARSARVFSFGFRTATGQGRHHSIFSQLPVKGEIGRIFIHGDKFIGQLSKECKDDICCDDRDTWPRKSVGPDHST